MNTIADQMNVNTVKATKFIIASADENQLWKLMKKIQQKSKSSFYNYFKIQVFI